MTNVRLANVLSVGSGRTLLLAGIASACLIGPGTASAISVYDFGQQAIDDGEQGYTNSPTPYSSTSNGLTLTATAYENGLDSHVYLDGPFGGRRGGMGVCSIMALSVIRPLMTTSASMTVMRKCCSGISAPLSMV